MVNVLSSCLSVDDKCGLFNHCIIPCMNRYVPSTDYIFEDRGYESEAFREKIRDKKLSCDYSTKKNLSNCGKLRVE